MEISRIHRSILPTTYWQNLPTVEIHSNRNRHLLVKHQLHWREEIRSREDMAPENEWISVRPLYRRHETEEVAEAIPDADDGLRTAIPLSMSEFSPRHTF
jgi:hypothetical protein